MRVCHSKLVYLFLALVALAPLSTAQSSLALSFRFTSNNADVGQTLVGNEFDGTASGGAPPYSYALSGNYPSGMVLSTSGTNRQNVATVGQASPQGSFNFSITVTDTQGSTATVGFHINILPDVSLVTTSVPNGALRSQYSALLQAAGGYPSDGACPNYAWSSSGSLPPGLALNSTTGAISGLPSSTGTYPFNIFVTDSCGANPTSATGSFSITITLPVSITGPTTLPAGTAGSAYGPVAFSAAGGTGSYTWSATGLPNGLTFSSAGVLSGTPGSAGSSTPQFTVTDSGRNTANVSLSLTINSLPAITGPTSLPAGTAGSAYGPVAFSATGGTGSYTWSATGLPNGLTFSSAGVLSGTPGSAGSSTPQFTVTDSSRNTANVSLSLTITSTVSITGPTSLPAGTAGSAYGPVAFSATGGTGSYTWSATGLPSGLIFSSAGVLSGTPGSAGSSTPQFTVTDSSRNTANVSLSLTINPPQLTITGPTSLPAGTAGSAYGPVAFSATGGTGSYTWSATGLPNGLIFSSAGVLSGTPGSAGGSTPQFTVTDSNRITANVSLSLTINPPLLTITGPTSLPAGTAGSAYGPVAFSATGGTGSYAWSATGLPNGLIFSSAGVLSGTPGSAGGSTPQFTVTDSNRITANVSLSLTINPPLLTITGPTSLPAGTAGSAYGPVAFSATGGTGSYAWSATGLPNGLGISPAGVLSGTPATGSQGNYTPQFTVTDSARNTFSASLSLLINPPNTQFPLTISVSPAGAGSVTATPGPTNGGYSPGTSVQLQATAAAKYSFSHWSGDLAGSDNPATLEMLGPHSITANFTSSPQSLSITTLSIPAGLTGVVYPATTFGATGGTGPYSWSKTSGALPPGSMSLSSGGVLSGTPASSGAFSFTVMVTDSSPTPLTASANFTLTVTQPGTLLSVTSQQLDFSYVQGDTNTPAPQIIGVLSNPSSTGIKATSITTDGEPWLIASQNFPGSQTPGTITVSVDPSKVAGPNTYSGQINIIAQNATPPSVTVNVTFQVSRSQAPQLTLTPPQSFALPNGGGASQGAVGVSNTGGGTLNYTSAASSDLNWLTITGGSQGSVTPSTPSGIAFSVNPNVSPGLHQGQITVTDTSGINPPQASKVTLLVSIPQAIMQLSESGLTFYAVQNSNVTPPPQTVEIYNLWGDTLSWTSQIQYTVASQNWLTVTPSGSSAAAAPGIATVSVSPAGLPVGQYYATVNVPSGAFNSPQSFSVLLNVVGAGQLGSSPQASTSGVILVAAPGSTAAATQNISLISPAGANPTFSTNVSTSSGGGWLSVTPLTGSLSGGSASLAIQASAAAVAAGVNYGSVQVAFQDGTIQTIQVALMATPGAASTPAFALTTSVHTDASPPSCTPTTLVATFSTPNANTPLTVGQAQPFQVQIVDNCNAPLLSSQSPTVQLFNESTSPPAHLADLTPGSPNGVWTSSWTPSSPGNVTLRVFASRGQTFGGISTPPNTVVDVTVLPASATGPPAPAAAINGASFDTNVQGLVVPGGYVSIYGQFMADSTAQASGGLLPPSLGNAQLLFESNGKTQPLPLLFVNKDQVNGLIPQNLTLNDTIQLQVQRDNTAAVPLSVRVTQVQPGIFTTNTQGTGQGSILIAGTGTVAGPASAGPPQQLPVTRGNFIEIYATGLGAVKADNGAAPPADGQPAPSAPGSPLFNAAPVTVTIGNVSVPASFAGLAPGYVALYQVNVQVPLNAPTGSAVQVVLTMTDSSGDTVSSPAGVTIAVQ